jgi:hypothetical protein
MLIPQTRDLTSYVAAYAPLLAVCVAVAVALMQYYLQRETHKQAMFEKRFDIYNAADNFIADVINRNCEPDRDSYREFLRLTAPAPFFFGADVLEALAWIKDISGRLATESDVPVIGSSSGQTEAQRQAFGGLRAAAVMIEWDERRVVFHPYLRLHHDQPWYTRAIAKIDEWMNAAERTTKARYSESRNRPA